MRTELLQFDGNLGLRLLPAARGDFSVLEEAQGAGDATDLQALALQRLVAAADDEFGTAAADVDDEALLVGQGQAVGDALVDQARLLASRDHFDRVAQGGFGGQQERLRVAQLAHRVGRHGAYPTGLEAGQALAEAGQTLECGFAPFGRQRAILLQSGCQAHAFAQAVDHAQFAMRVAGNDEVEAVRADVGSGDQVAVADFIRELRALHEQSFFSRVSWAECGLSLPGCMRV